MSVFIYLFIGIAIFMIPMFYVAVFGKTILERIAAVDVIGALAIAALMIFAIYKGRNIYMDIALTLALLDFLGNLAFARFIARRWE